MRFRAIVRYGIALLAVFSLLTGGILWLHFVGLQPMLSEEIEIRPGIRYKSERVRTERGREFQAMVIKVDLANPAVSVFQPKPKTDGHGHFRLAFPDWLLWNNDLDVLVNTTPFHAERVTGQSNALASDRGIGKSTDFPGLGGYPGRNVWSTEPVVSEGEFSFIPRYAQLFWIDYRNRAHIALRLLDARFAEMLEPTQPGNIRYGFGLQAVYIVGGEIRHVSLNERPDDEAINNYIFLGIDESGDRLTLIGLAAATLRELAIYAQRQGIFVGGLLDSGNAGWLIVGSNAANVLPHSGIRGGRPIGAFMGFRSR